ncbi:MAG: hypothetical protein ACREX9_12965 [Gammaproteobacteria bacterium]
MTTGNRYQSRKANTRQTEPPALIAYHVTERGEKSLSVAYGPDDIGTIIRMEDTPDFRGGRSGRESWRDGYISKDMV